MKLTESERGEAFEAMLAASGRAVPEIPTRDLIAALCAIEHITTTGPPDALPRIREIAREVVLRGRLAQPPDPNLVGGDSIIIGAVVACMVAVIVAVACGVLLYGTRVVAGSG